MPDFVKALTKTERLMNDIPSDFFKMNAPSKPTDDTYRENFERKVFAGDISPEKVRDQYSSTLKALR